MQESPLMPTRYIEPLSAAYRRMKLALFQPFDLGKWFAVGFASWIAGWSSGGGYNYGTRFPVGGKSGKDPNIEDAFGSFLKDLAALWANPWVRVGLVAVVILFLALVVLILWINSRGEFVFLDAVVNGRRDIAAPWRVWKTQGNSLFVFRLVFGLAVFSVFVMLSTAGFFLGTGGRIPGSFDEVPWIRVLIGIGIPWIGLTLASLYANLFVRHFVTPIMFRDRSTTMEAWRTFWPLLRERLGAFLVYGLFDVFVHIGLVLALIPAILLTCCVLGCLLVIPFIGAVVWLPVSYTFRAFGPEFLAQFGSAYRVWPQPLAGPEASTDTSGLP